MPVVCLCRGALVGEDGGVLWGMVVEHLTGVIALISSYLDGRVTARPATSGCCLPFSFLPIFIYPNKTFRFGKEGPGSQQNRGLSAVVV